MRLIRLRPIRLVPLLVTAAALGLHPGCDEKPTIQTYDAPKDQPAPSRPTPSVTEAPPQTATPEAASPAAPIQWTLPPGWVADPNPQPPRLASFTVANADDPTSGGGGGGEVTITRFPGDVGGELANINRWRRQLELPPIDDPAQQPSQSISLGGYPCTVYRISKDDAQPQDTAIVVATILDRESSWFVKMTGPSALIADQAEHFIAFLVNLKLPLAAPPPAASTGGQP